MHHEVVGARRYTLVVGAGVNTNRNVPGWAALVQRAWHEVFGEEKDYRRDVVTRLAEARSAVQRYCGWSEEEAERLDLAIHPLEPQFALELIDLQIRENAGVADRVRRLVGETAPGGPVSGGMILLPQLLRWCLYEHVRWEGAPDTLSELARFIRYSKRLVRVISLNVDNLLELEVSRTEPAEDRVRFLQVISRQRHRPGPGVSTYHLHGFLPIKPPDNAPAEGRRRHSGADVRGMKGNQDLEHMTEAVPESIVFTDSQYWQSVATPLSFANFVFANALHDSSCIFIGLSMTDLNIIRWLGLHAAEFRNEYEREFRSKGLVYEVARSPYTRHCWIRSRSSDPSGLITSFLARRGVDTEIVQNWEAEAVRAVLDELLRADPAD